MAEATRIIFDGPSDAPMTVALAHGAGAPMDSPFMDAVAEGLAAHGLRAARFEFPYLAKRRSEGSKKPPDRAPVLLQTWRAVIERLGPDRLIVGGKSMGGRMASMIAREIEDEGTPVRGVACLGYPFHPPGKPDRLRTEHLETIRTPTLILQGERDPFGTRDEVGKYALSNAIELHWLPDGDHGFKPRKSSGHSEDGNIAEAVAVLARFAAAL